MLEVKNVYTGYGNRPVLYNISFVIKEREVILLTGSNGSGKSTILKYIYNLIPFFREGLGKVIFDGNDITGIKSSSLINKGLAYIPQKINVFENLTVKDNLEVSGLTLKDKILYKKRRQEVFDIFPILRDLTNRLPMKLSGGEKQILAFAMTLLHKPKMILADEPFAGLSFRNIETLKNQIKKLNRTYGITFLIVEHRIKESYDIADRIIQMKLGHIVSPDDRHDF